MRTNRGPLITPFRLGVLLSILAALCYSLLVVNHPTLFTVFNNRMADVFFSWRGAVAPANRVVIVDIDEKSIAGLGQWPWSRTVIAGLVSRLQEAGAQSIAFDVVFAEADRTSPVRLLDELRPHLEDNSLFDQVAVTAQELDHDLVLGAAVAKAPVVLGYIFRTDGAVNLQATPPFPSIALRTDPPAVELANLSIPEAKDVIANIPAVAQAPTEGFLNFFPDSAGTVRDTPLFLSFNGIPYPSMALEAYRTAVGIPEITIHAASQLHNGQRTVLGVTAKNFIPTDDRGRLTINFRGPAKTFPYLSAVDVLQGPADPRLAKAIVLIGTSAAGLLDLRSTPFASVCPGVEIHATIIDNILQQDPLRYDTYTEAGLTYTLILGGGILLSFLLTAAPPLAGGLAGFLLPVTVIAGDYFYYFRGQNTLIGIGYPLAALTLIFLLITLANYLTEGSQKRYIQTAFGHYVSPEIVKRLIRDPSLLALSGDQRPITILFSDIRGFTTLSEKMTPEQLGQFMNRYLTAMSDIVMGNLGTVDKFIGDAVMALWGAPADDSEHATHAVQAALAMQRTLDQLRPQWQAEGFPAVFIGVGINTGPASVGNFGSRQRFDYTALGDHVNLASRLEGANKVYGTGVIISEFTKEATAERFFCRLLDLVRMKGKTEPVSIYEPLCEGEPSAPLRQEVAAYEEAMASYQARSFAQAGQAFTALATATGHPLYALYQERCRQYQAEPPSPDWDGVYTFTSK